MNSATAKPAKRATMGDVARLANVSKATVSSVLNGTGVVRGSTRERVLNAISMLNYRVGPVLTGPGQLKGGKGLGLVIKEIDNPYYSEIVTGAQRVADELGYTLLVATSEGDYNAEGRAVDLLYARGIDGLIVTPVLDETADLTHLFNLKRRNYPFVLLERVIGVQASLVDVDNVEASRRATEYLISRGHRRIVHFSGPRYSMHSQERTDGARRACGAASLVFTDSDVVDAGAHLESGYRAALSYFQACPADERPTAVTCYNDLVAIGLIRALATLGLRVPDDVSVVGFDDIPLVAYLPVPLTTMRMPKERMGATAAQMLIRHVESRSVLPPERVTLESELIERESVRTIEPGDSIRGRRLSTG